MKRVAILIHLLVRLTFGSAQAKTLGDFNDDDNLTIADAIAFIMHLMGKVTLPEIGRDIKATAKTDTIYVLVADTVLADSMGIFLECYVFGEETVVVFSDGRSFAVAKGYEGTARQYECGVQITYVYGILSKVGVGRVGE